MAQAHSAQIQQDLLASDQESLYREVMQESYNTIFRASPLQLQKSELLAHLKRGQEDWAQDLQSSSNGADQRLVKEALKKWPEAGTWWNSYRSPVSVPSSDSSSSADDEITSEKEEEENIQWESQRIAKPRAALLGKWENIHRQGKTGKVQHSRLQECHTSINCADVKKKGLLAHSNGQQGINAEESQNECSVCGKNFGRRSSLNRHFKIHSGDKPFRCSTCGKCFLVKTSLVLHKESMHKKRSRSRKKFWECPECGQNFATKAFLTEHKKMHTSEKTYPCPVCEKSFTETRYLVKHLTTTHSGEHVFKCPVCGKGFMKEKDLTRHQGKSNCFRSLDSEKSCKEKSSPIQRKRLHLNHEMPVSETLFYMACKGNDVVEHAYTCCHCGKSFKQERSFINHQSGCIREQQSNEGNILKEDGLLTKNQITYVNMKDNTCFDCEKPVCKNSLLASQPKTDKEKNLRVCPECGKSFRDRQCFANHLRSHKKAPPQNISNWEGLEEKTPPADQQEMQQKESRYQCLSCRRDYATHYNLRRHQQIHVECWSRKNAHKVKDSTYSWFFRDFQKARGKEPAHQLKCTYCGKGFRTKSTLSRHQQIHIRGKPYKCNICGKAFMYRYTLAHHQEIHLEDQLYQHKCSFCAKAFRTQSALRRHEQLHMEGKPYICNICGKAFAYRYNLTHHREIHIEGQIHKCSFCWKAFRTSYSLNRHKRIHTETRSYQCPTCGKAFGTKYSLYRHQEMHVKENVDSLFSRKETGDNLVKDQASNSSDSVVKQVANSVHLPCQGVCKEKNPLEGSGNTGSSDLPDHPRTRVEENAVKPAGSQTFRNAGPVLKDQDRPTKGELQQWTNSSVFTGWGVQVEGHPPRPSENGEISLVHHSTKEADDRCFLGKLPDVGQQGMITQKKKCTCPDCGKSFRDKYSLTRHQKTHFPEKLHQCLRCEKSFRKSTDLEKHQVTHSDLRPHQCAECGKYFKRKSSLEKHKKIHKGEKPYCCSYCGKRVTTNSILRYHQRIHTGERPYKCTVCDKSYVTRWSLKKHSELHYKRNLPGGPQEANQLDQKC